LSGGIGRTPVGTPLGMEAVLNALVGFYLRAEKALNVFRMKAELRRAGLGIGDDLQFPWRIFNGLARVPFAQGDLVGDGQALTDGL
jgi:hypothetical protein